MEHTPTPWATYPWRGDVVAIIEPATKNHIAHLCGGGPGIAEVEANAAFIVRAVNAHDELVTALRVLMSQFEQSGAPWMHDPAMVQARAALAKATRPQ